MICFWSDFSPAGSRGVLAVDFDYQDLREREYPLLAARALEERLRHAAALFPANPGYEFQILYQHKG